MLLNEIIPPLQQRVTPKVTSGEDGGMVKPMTIKHSGARTRALYAWENELFYDTPAGHKPLLRKRLQALAQQIWAGEGWDSHYKCPEIRVAQMNELSYTLGRKLIVLSPTRQLSNGRTVRDDTAVTLIHEIVHARGHGTASLMHPVGFVKVYIRLLGKYLGWDVNELTDQARERGLI